MAEPISIQQLKDASEDAITLADFIYKPANVMIPRRLAADINSLQYYLDYMSSYAQRSYETYDEMVANAVNLPNGVSAFVTNDLDATKNGIYTYNGSSFVKGDYQPENAAKDYVESKLVGLQVLDGKVRAQDVSTTNGRTQLDKNRENVSALDFFTQEELAEYLPTVGVINAYYDAYRPLQEFFDYISANDVGTAYCDGDFGTSQAIIVGGATGCKTKSVIGKFKLTAMNTLPTIIDDLLTFWTASNFNWSGIIWVEGNTYNSTAYDRRKVLNGIRIGGKYNATHSRFPAIIAMNGFKNWGVILDNLSTGTIIEKIRANRSGSGYITPGYKPYEDANFIVKETIEGTTTQRSVLAVDNFLDFSKIEGIKYVYIDNKLYWLDPNAIDAVNKTISISPTLPSGIISGNLRYIYGGGFYTKGGDASVTKVGNINVSTSAICISLEALYPPVIDAVTTQENFLSLSIGASLSAAVVGGVIGEHYFEANTFDIVQNTKWKSNLRINNTVAVKLDKCLNLSNTRGSSGELVKVYGLTIELKTTNDVLRPISSTAGNNVSVEVFDIDDSDTLYMTGTSPKTINLKTSDFNGYRLFNKREKTIVVHNGTGAIIGDVTINAPVGSKINGQDTIVLSGYVGAVIISVYLYGETNLNVTASGSRTTPSAQKTYNAPSLDAATTQTTTLALTGAKIGDAVAVSLDQPLLGTRLWGEVTAENLVTIYHRNDTAEAVDVTSGTLKAKVL